MIVGDFKIDPADYAYAGDYSVTFTFSNSVGTNPDFPCDVTFTWTISAC